MRRGGAFLRFFLYLLLMNFAKDRGWDRNHIFEQMNLISPHKKSTRGQAGEPTGLSHPQRAASSGAEMARRTMRRRPRGDGMRGHGPHLPRGPPRPAVLSTLLPLPRPPTATAALILAPRLEAEEAVLPSSSRAPSSRVFARSPLPWTPPDASLAMQSLPAAACASSCRIAAAFPVSPHLTRLCCSRRAGRRRANEFGHWKPESRLKSRKFKSGL